MTKAEKKQKQLEQISEALAAFENAEKQLTQLSKLYTEWIDQAAIDGEDDYSNELLECQVDLDEFIADLRAMHRDIERTTIQATAFEQSFSKLPAAVTACNELLRGMPDLTKTGKAFKKLYEKLNKARSSFRNLRSELALDPNRKINPALSSLGVGDPKRRERIEAAKRARDARIAVTMSRGAAVSVAGEAAEAASTDKAAAIPAGATDIDAIDAMIADENKRN